MIEENIWNFFVNKGGKSFRNKGSFNRQKFHKRFKKVPRPTVLYISLNFNKINRK